MLNIDLRSPPAATDIDQLREEVGLELEDDELRILARIEDATERQLELLKIEERKYIHLILDLRDKLNDANLAVRELAGFLLQGHRTHYLPSLQVMNKTMRSVLSFNELIQLSDACIDNVLKESKRYGPFLIDSIRFRSNALTSIRTLRLFKLPGLRNPSLMALAIDLVIEVAVLMKRCNDFSVGINQPTLEKLEKFKQDYALRVRLPLAFPKKEEPPFLICACLVRF